MPVAASSRMIMGVGAAALRLNVAGRACRCGPPGLACNLRPVMGSSLSWRSHAGFLGNGGIAVVAGRHLRVSPFCCATRQRTRAAAAAGPDGGLANGDPPSLSGDEIRKRFINFYVARGHTALPSSSLVPEDPTVLLTIAGMLQFKPVFLGQVPRAVPRATTAQKCVRTNDIENVGVTARHHTFFEMLGNFSFGDYFKAEAIPWAWELATKEFGLPPERVWVSVYESDDAAYALWRDAVGVPESRIKRMGAADNFWASGPTGPCGPCSELYYDLRPEMGDGPGADLGDGTRFLEFYNLVFMQSNRRADGSLEDLAAPCIDTGLGLERLARILQRTANNYETDVMLPLVETAARLTGVDYATCHEPVRCALKVVADHTRAVVHLLGDGVRPSNVGRGYILRRLMRRSILKARAAAAAGRGAAASETSLDAGDAGDDLGAPGAMVTPLVAAEAIRVAAGAHPTLAAQSARILAEVEAEERRFAATLKRGGALLESLLAGGQAAISGPDAFLLYDTYGFPLEITAEIAAGRGAGVDAAGFAACLASQVARSKAAVSALDLTSAGALAALVPLVGATRFEGYASLVGEAPVVALLRGGVALDSATPGEEVDVLLPSTPFYAESGGQVGDVGVMACAGGGRLVVRDVIKAAGGALFLHRATVEGAAVAVGEAAAAAVDPRSRRAARCHHTATHLLLAALKRVLGGDITQAGSYCGFDRLRFDFHFGRAVTPAEMAAVEALINTWIEESIDTSTSEMALADAKAGGAVATFGEKYGATVRVVTVPGVSVELCGGTHVANTSELATVRLLSEGAVAAGIRRVEALAGAPALRHLQAQDDVVRALGGALRVPPAGVAARVAAVTEELRASGKEAASLRSALAVQRAGALVETAMPMPGGGRGVVGRLDGADGEGLRAAADAVVATLGDPCVVVLASIHGGDKVAFVAACSPGAVAGGANAGTLVSAAAKLCGGGGGGKPAAALAGGRDAAKLPEAMERAAEAVFGAKAAMAAPPA